LPIFLVMPDLDTSYLKNVLTKINSKDLEKYILSLNYIANEELLYLYNLASLFLYPSLYESFGIPILESMACGTPVITSNTSAMPEISGGASILVDPYNIDQLANQIESFFSSSYDADSVITQGLKRVEDFSWDNTAQKVLKLYKSMPTNHHKPSKITSEC